MFNYHLISKTLKAKHLISNKMKNNEAKKIYTHERVILSCLQARREAQTGASNSTASKLTMIIVPIVSTNICIICKTL